MTEQRPDQSKRDCEIEKYPKIRYPDHGDVEGLLSDGEIIFVEKIDGANFRFKRFDQDTLLFGSRNTIFSEHDEPADRDRIGNAFRHTAEYLYNTLNLDTLADVESEYGELWYYGEAMHKHSINYDAWDGREPEVDGPVPNFIGFAIYSRDNQLWLSWDETTEIYDTLGIQTPREVRRKPADEVTEDDREIPQSEFREENPDADTEFDQQGLAEGLVIRNDDLGLVSKLVHDTFREKDGVSFTDADQINSQAGQFVGTFCTRGRVRKQAHKIVDDPETDYNELEMSMMSDLPKRVLEDVMAEHGWEILNNDMELTEDVKGKIRSRTSKKCVRVLKEEMNALV